MERVALALLCVGSAAAHVTFTWPPARNWPVDFLDSIRTPDKAPCGVNDIPDGSPRTQILSNSTITLTWHTAYAHQGGYKVTLFRSDDTSKSIDEWSYAPESPKETDTTRLEQEVTISSNWSTGNYFFSVARSALERKDNYEFFSCADISIVGKFSNDEARCGKGYVAPDVTAPANGSEANSDDACACGNATSGERCQYKNDCDEDSHCHGDVSKCLEVSTTHHPKKQCFCESGRFGVTCARQSAVKSISVKGSHRRVDLDAHTLYYRIVNNELELIFNASTTSWAAIGFRPSGDTDYVCKPEYWTNSRFRGSHDLNGILENAMDCTDIFIASARGRLGRVGDYYTRSKATPLLDTVFGDDESLTAAVAEESGGRTVFLVRRPTAATHFSDHTIEDADLQVIWAIGQRKGTQTYQGKSGHETGSPSISADDYYADDELKYHGHIAQRGKFTLNFFRLPSVTTTTTTKSTTPDTNDLTTPETTGNDTETTTYDSGTRQCAPLFVVYLLVARLRLS